MFVFFNSLDGTVGWIVPALTAVVGFVVGFVPTGFNDVMAVGKVDASNVSGVDGAVRVG